MTDIDEKARRAIALYVMGEISQTAIRFAPKRRFLKRRYYMQVSLDLIEWTLIEFGTKDEYIRQLRKVFPEHPELSTYMEGILDDAWSKVTLFGWTKKYKKQLAKLKDVLKGEKL